MDQPVDTHTAAPAPNPAATSTRESSTSFNLNYVTSPPGMLKIAEFIFGLICWATLASFTSIVTVPAHQFVLFVSITAWLLTLFTFVIYMLGLHSTMLSGAPWSIIEFANNAAWSVMYFIAACVDAAYAGNVGSLIASTVFAFFTTIVFIFHTFISFKEWRGSFPWG